MSLPLRTRRLLIDALRPSDAEALFGYRSLPEVAKFQSWKPSAPEDAIRFIAAAVGAEFDQAGTWYQLALRRLDNGELVGDIGLHFLPDDDRQVELGVTVSPRHQRGGLATEATSAVIEFLFRDLQKHRVMASVDPANEAVRRLLDRLGFRQEAHFRQSLRVGDTWVDDMIYAVLRSEWTR